MKKIIVSFLLLFVFTIQEMLAQEKFTTHPNTASQGWHPLFKNDLSNSIAEPGVWTVENGVFTASKDEALWSEKTYNDFSLDVEFKNADSTNSGVIVHASDIKNWIPHSVVAPSSPFTVKSLVAFLAMYDCQAFWPPLNSASFSNT